MPIIQQIQATIHTFLPCLIVLSCLVVFTVIHLTSRNEAGKRAFVLSLVSLGALIYFGTIMLTILLSLAATLQQ